MPPGLLGHRTPRSIAARDAAKAKALLTEAGASGWFWIGSHGEYDRLVSTL
ncbi:MAG: hypothetical protein ACREEV_06090 [Dongiaceae bacterium]